MIRTAIVLILLVSCTAEKGDSCTLDSDCGSGLVCSFSSADVGGQCIEPEEVIYPQPDAGAGVDSPEDAGEEPEQDDLGDATLVCAQKTGSLCPTPVEKRKVISMKILESGHGMAGLASVANSIIADAFKNGEITLEAWVDGTLADGCEADIAWIIDPDGVADGCELTYLDSFPLTMPAFAKNPPVINDVLDAVFDPSTNQITGHFSRDAFKAGLKSDVAPLVDNLAIEEDYDTDGDGTPDHLSVILELGFE